jgi:Asp-tRNA(Asn)/Glu-tRNA(Gln) amidotransferase A subunit family amidase
MHHPITAKSDSGMSTFDVVEASIAELRAALESGAATSEDLVTSYLRRIDRYDKNGPTLNSVVVPNPAALVEARDADLRCERGRVLGPLDGIPYTAKDSFLVPGLTAAAGSPAFVDLVAMRDAATIGRLREAGAICLGLTNMPPMANGGMQRGVYGRAESPYNPEFLTSAFASGSSNGSGTSPAASFAAFGLAEETWSSGRAPTRRRRRRGRRRRRVDRAVGGKRLGVPRMYIGRDDAAGTGTGGLGSPTGTAIDTRPSIRSLFERARHDLELAGATVVDVDFPVVSNYEGDRVGAPTIANRGIVRPEFLREELVDLAAYPSQVREHPYASFKDIPELEAGVHALEETRRRDLEDWMSANTLDAVVFPTVTVPMGIMDDIRMPVGITFVGAAYSDLDLLSIGVARITKMTPRDTAVGM